MSPKPTHNALKDEREQNKSQNGKETTINQIKSNGKRTIGGTDHNEREIDGASLKSSITAIWWETVGGKGHKYCRSVMGSRMTHPMGSTISKNGKSPSCLNSLLETIG